MFLETKCNDNAIKSFNNKKIRKLEIHQIKDLYPIREKLYNYVEMP